MDPSKCPVDMEVSRIPLSPKRSSMPVRATLGKRKKVVLTFEEKLEIVQRVENKEKATDIASYFGIGKSTVHEIYRYKKQLFEFCSTSLINESMTKKRRAMRKPMHELIEKCMHIWYIQERIKGTSVSGAVITRKAAYYDKMINGENSKFKASSGWLFRFKQRFGITHLHAELDLCSVMQKDITSFKEKLKGLIRTQRLDESRIYYACEVRLSWKSLPDKVTEIVGSNAMAAKERLTFLLCVNATGLHKLPLLIIANPSIPGQSDVTDLPSRLVSTEESCLDPVILKNWFRNSFIPAVKLQQGLRNDEISQNAVLILESSPAHPFTADELSTEDGSIQAILLPPNCINKKLSLSSGIPEIFKRDYRLAQIKKTFGNIMENKTSLLQYAQDLTLEAALKLSVDVWVLVKEDDLARQWKAFFSNLSIKWAEESKTDGVDETNQPPVVMVILDIFTRHEELKGLQLQDITDWMERVDTFLVFPVLADEDIIDKVKREAESVTETITPKRRKRPCPGNEEIMRHLDKCIRWLKSQDQYEDGELQVLRKLKFRARDQMLADNQARERFSNHGDVICNTVLDAEVPIDNDHEEIVDDENVVKMEINATQTDVIIELPGAGMGNISLLVQH